MNPTGAEPLDQLPVAIARVRDGIVLSANKAACELLGLAVARPFAEPFPEAERTAVAAFVADPADSLLVRLRTGAELCAVQLRATVVDGTTMVVAHDVTEERRARALVNNVFDVANIVNDSGAVFWQSDATLVRYDEWGMTVEDVAKTSLLEWTHPEDIPMILELLSAALQGKIKTSTWKTRWHAPGHDEWFVSRQVGCVAFDDPDIGGIIHVQLDRTDVDVEEPAQSEDWRFLTLAEAAPVGILIGMLDGYVAYYNRLAEELLGTVERAAGAWLRAARAEFHDDLGRIWDGALRGERGRAVAAVDRPDGERVWIEITAVPQCDVNGEPAGVVATLADITDSVLARRDAERVLRVLDLGHDFVVITDGEGNISHVNRAAEEQLGLQRAVSPDDIFTPGSARIFGLDVLGALSEHGTWTGELELRGVVGNVIPVSVVATAERDAAGDIESFAFVCRDISELKAVECKLRELATHDPLTGLPNRAMLLERLDAAFRLHAWNGHAVALLFCDLDDFKLINDEAGHEAGDSVLCTVADRLLSITRADDMVARIGGDEFVVLCESFESDDDLRTLAARVAVVVGEPIAIGGRVANVGVSVGVAVAGVDASTAEPLLDHADRQMYSIKRGRKRQGGYASTA